MKLPQDISDVLIAATAKELADRMGRELNDLQLVPIRKAADLLGVSESKARTIIREFVELGEASKRVRLSTLKRIIEERTYLTA